MSTTTEKYEPNRSPEELVGADRAAMMAKLSANENPFGPSPKTVQALQAGAETLGLYPSPNDAALKEALLAHHGRSLTAENLVTACGGCDVLNLIALSYLDEHSRCIICPPTFPVYQVTASKRGAEIISVPLDPENFSYQLADIEKAITPNTRVLYLCNPNNPTGTHVGQDTLEGMLSLLPEGAVLVYDEVYYHFADKGALPDAIPYVAAGENIIIIHSFSKAYGLAGLRVGYAIAKPDIIARLERHKNPFHMNTLALAAATAALSDEAYTAKVVANNTQGRVQFTEGLRQLGLEVWPSQANFVLVRAPEGFDAKQLTQALLDYDIIVRPAFGLPEHIRVSIGTPDHNHAFLAAMRSLLTS